LPSVLKKNRIKIKSKGHADALLVLIGIRESVRGCMKSHAVN